MLMDISLPNESQEDKNGGVEHESVSDALYTTQTQSILTTWSIDKLLAYPDLYHKTKDQLIRIKGLIPEDGSDSLCEDVLSIEDGRLMIGDYPLPVRRSVKQSLSFDNIAEQASPIKHLLSFAAWLVGKRFDFTSRDAVIKKEIDADAFVTTINEDNHDVLAILRLIFWFDYTIPFVSAKDDKYIVLQIGSKGSRFHVLD